MKLKHLIVPSLLALSLAACKQGTDSKTPDTKTKVETTDATKVEAAKPDLGTFGIELANMDKSLWLV